MNGKEHRHSGSVSPLHDPCESPAPGLDDSRVVEALEEYLAAAEGGRPPDRRSFLARHADIADPLAECLDGLAALHGAGSSSNPTATGSHAPGRAVEGTPEMALGDFRIVREIGRGGMGVVYEAVQLSLGRRVALKVLPFAAALDTRQLQRFKNEAQAAAHLHHQNIVPVHAVGAERGVHYYAMQLIEGQNLANLIADLRLQIADCPDKSAMASDAPPPTVPGVETRANFGGRLTTQRSGRVADFFRTIARLAAQAAEALEYAHAMGVIHRDVKPANLLVDDRGNLWVTDFGLAQFQAGAGLTQTGDLLGTLRYMSPEQAGGKNVLIDHRTDVYSLGATLYEMLTLRPIFDGADQQRLLHQILDEEPQSPQSAEPAIPPELDTIVLKAVNKSPADRYASAQEFADDLHRFLENQPIRARRPTLAQRARKWGQRHPTAVIAAIVLLVLVAIGSMVSTALISAEEAKTKVEEAKAKMAQIRAEAEEGKAKAEEAKAKAAAQRERQRAEQAENRLKIAREAVDEIIQVAEAELIDRHGMEGVRNRLLELALTYNQRLIEEARDDPNARADLAVTRGHVEKILADLTALQSEGQFKLLNSPDVLTDLDTTPKQTAQIADLHSHVDQQLHDWFERSGRLPHEERPKPILGFAEAAAAKEKGAREILNPEQLRRLKQIDLQLKEVSAFRDPDVVATLKLTDAQKERIRTIEGDRFSGPGRRVGSAGSSKPEPDRRPPSEKVKEVQRDVLTVEQFARWKEMTGEPFKGKVFRPGAPPGPPH
jgi:eukaryotic-like serine/threonine-protein kinase